MPLDIVEGDFDKNKKGSTGEDQGNSNDPAGKKRFPNLLKMVNGLRSNKKERTDMEKSSEIGDSQKTDKLSRKGGTGTSSTISRMWNSLFPNKESPEMPKSSSEDVLQMPENRSTKTLGRMFTAKLIKDYDKNNADQISRPKSSTLGRKISQSFRQFKSSEPSSNIIDDKNPITSPTTSLEHGNVTPTPV
ncbi:hypothetical protein O3M35_006086 [Rhynocoris fuscipes]|uniref:Uncharacterized protein n=1 Tax=Rhynocoris fuscipes TaxID=488301 RepID=A0AAW1DEN1_9HEMI